MPNTYSDGRSRVVALKSVCLFTSWPTGAQEYAVRIDGAVFSRYIMRHDGKYKKMSAWELLEDKKLAKFLRKTTNASVFVRGVGFERKTTTRLRLPQSLGA